MTANISAGLLIYRWRRSEPEFLLVHPGGPFWARKDAAAWSIPKGLADEGEDLFAAAVRETAEELGGAIAMATPVRLPPCRTPGGKIIHAWMVEAEIDVAAVRSNLFAMEWPKGSGQTRQFPEVDRAAYFQASEVLWKIHRGQRPLLEDAIRRLQAEGGVDGGRPVRGEGAAAPEAA